jgi:hypothetical protein
MNLVQNLHSELGHEEWLFNAFQANPLKVDQMRVKKEENLKKIRHEYIN